MNYLLAIVFLLYFLRDIKEPDIVGFSIGIRPLYISIMFKDESLKETQ